MYSTPTTTTLNTSPQTHAWSNNLNLPNKAPNLDVVCDFVKKSAFCSSEQIYESDIVPELKC